MYLNRNTFYLNINNSKKQHLERTLSGCWMKLMIALIICYCCEMGKDKNLAYDRNLICLYCWKIQVGIFGTGVRCWGSQALVWILFLFNLILKRRRSGFFFKYCIVIIGKVKITINSKCFNLVQIFLFERSNPFQSPCYLCDLLFLLSSAYLDNPAWFLTRFLLFHNQHNQHNQQKSH